MFRALMEQASDEVDSPSPDSERRDLEAQLRLAASIVDASNDAVIGTRTVDGVITTWTGAAERIYGYTAEEAVGRSFEMLVGPDLRSEARALLEAIRGGDRIEGFETVRLRKDRSDIHVSLTITPIRDSTGAVVAAYTISRDVSDRYRAQAELGASQERYRLLFDHNPVPMWLYDRQSLRFLAVNQAAVQDYGYSEDEFLAMTIRDIRPTEDVPLLEERLQSATSDEAEWWRHRRKDGEVFDVEVLSHGLRLGQTDARLVIAQDVTARKRAEDDLRKAFESERAAA